MRSDIENLCEITTSQCRYSISITIGTLLKNVGPGYMAPGMSSPTRREFSVEMKPLNVILDTPGNLKIGDLSSNLFCNLRLLLTSGIETPVYMTPDMYRVSHSGVTTRFLIDIGEK
jgi:hypothetical protein